MATKTSESNSFIELNSCESSCRPLFTICTPTFNRAGLLTRVFESLKGQTALDFEWLIVDDGSTDATGDVVRQWTPQVLFPVRYVWKENGGKHTALNVAVQAARGVLFTVVDSDDWLLPEGLERLSNGWETIRTKANFAGACGLFQYTDGRVVGSHFPRNELVSNAIDLRLKLGVTGDKIGFTRTEIMRRFPFPEDFGRFYVPESIVWNRIAQEFDTLFINERIGVKEYQPEGITDKSALNSWRNPMAYLTRAADLLNGRRGLPIGSTIRSALTLSKCAISTGSNPFIAKRLIHKLVTAGALPVAIVLLFRDWLRAKNAARKLSNSSPEIS